MKARIRSPCHLSTKSLYVCDDFQQQREMTYLYVIYTSFFDAKEKRRIDASCIRQKPVSERRILMSTGFTIELSPVRSYCRFWDPPRVRHGEGSSIMYVYTCAVPKVLPSKTERPLKGTAKHIVFDAKNGKNRNDIVCHSEQCVAASLFGQLANFDSTQVSSPMGENKEVTSYRSPF